MAEAMGRPARNSDRLDRAVVAAPNRSRSTGLRRYRNRTVTSPLRSKRVIAACASSPAQRWPRWRAHSPPLWRDREEKTWSNDMGGCGADRLVCRRCQRYLGHDQSDRAYCFGPELVPRVRMPLRTDHVAVVAAPPLGRRVTLLFCTWKVPLTVPCASC